MKKTFIVFSILAIISLACSLPYFTAPEPPQNNLALTVTAQAKIIQNRSNQAGQAPAVPAVPVIQPASTVTATATVTETPQASPTPTITPTGTPSTPMVTPLKDAVNCRFGPGVNYQPVFALAIGAFAPVTGKSTDGGWLQIKTTDTDNPFCWVSIPFVTSSGDLSAVPTVPTPISLITDVEVYVKPDSTNLGPGCVGPYPQFKITATITTNGPLKVYWYIETQQDGMESTHSVNFPTFATEYITSTYTPSTWKKGNFWVHFVISSPGSITRSASYQVLCQ